LAFFQAIKSALTKRETNVTRLTDEAKEFAIRQIIGKTLVSDGVLDIFKVAGLDKPQVSILSEEFMEDVRRMKERNLAVELLERLLKDKIKAKFKTNIIQQAKFSDLLDKTLTKYQNRAIETAQVIEELIELAKEFENAKNHGEKLGLNDDETAFYDALLTNEASVRELGDDVLKMIAVELTQSLRKSLTVDWSKRDSVKAAMRIRIRTLLAKYKYPYDKQKDAVDLILRQAENLSEEWVF
jgi:type I restriction enzyme R subunit